MSFQNYHSDNHPRGGRGGGRGRGRGGSREPYFEQQQQFVDGERDRILSERGAGRGGKRPGRGNRQRRAENFTDKKNEQTQQEKNASIDAKLRVAAPKFTFTNARITEVQWVAVSLIGIVSYFNDFIWPQIIQITGRTFQQHFPDEESRRQAKVDYFRVLIRMLASKIQASHKLAGERPFNFTLSGVWSDEEIKVYDTLASTVPKIIAPLIDTLGRFSLSGQDWLPRFATSRQVSLTMQLLENSFYAFNPDMFTRTLRDALINTAIPLDYYQRIRCEYLSECLGVEWIVDQANQTFSLRNNLQVNNIVLSDREPTSDEMRTWTQISVMMKGKPDWMMSSSIVSGDGTPAQMVMTEGFYDQNMTVQYYSQDDIAEGDFIYGIAYGYGCTSWSILDRHHGITHHQSRMYTTEAANKIRAVLAYDGMANTPGVK